MRFATADEAATVAAAARREVNRTRSELIDYIRSDAPRVAKVDELVEAAADALLVLDAVTE
jgi:hypothetical protein